MLNTNGAEKRGADVIVDASLNSDQDSVMTVVFNSAHTAGTQELTGSHPVGSRAQINRTAEGRAFVRIRNMPPAEVAVLANHP